MNITLTESVRNLLLAPSPIINFLTPVFKGLSILAAVFVIGQLFTFAFLATNEKGALNADYRVNRKYLLTAAITWFLLTFASGVLSLAQLLAVPFGSVLDSNTLKSYFFQTGIGQATSYSLVFIAIAIFFIAPARKIGSLITALVFAMLSLISPIFESHSVDSGNHALAVGTLLFHVVFLSIWVGGLIGLSLLTQSERTIALARFSKIAFLCAIATVLSGSFNAITKFTKFSDLFSSYGLALLTKVALTFIIISYGYRHRLGLRRYSLFVQEIIFMLITIGIGTWLSVLKPPLPENLSMPSPALTYTGLELPDAPNLRRIFFSFAPDVIYIVLTMLALIAYFAGVKALKRREITWSKYRTASFIFFVFLVNFATSGGLGIYSYFAFSFHMMAHMVLGMVAPIFLVLSAPITLALRTLPTGRTPNEKGLRQLLVGVLNSRYSKIIAHPVVALALLDGSLFVLYFTPLFSTLMRSHVGHLLMGMHFIAAGALFFYLIVGIDPNPKKIPFLARIVLLFAAMAIHAFFSIAVLSSSTLFDNGYFSVLGRMWHLDLLADQHLGGSIGWSLSEVPVLIALIATFIQWVRDDNREQKRIAKSSVLAHSRGEPDELDLYNEYLKKLNNSN